MASSLLSSHLEQISLCANSIAELPFPGPKIFTNALLSNHDITALIRDTEVHERALFHLAPPAISTKASDFTSSVNAGPQTASQRRATQYGARQPRSKAVAAVLGGELYQKTRREGALGKQKGEMNVEVLLEGAEKLVAAYPIRGASEKIAALRQRHQQLAANIAHYEDRVSRNTQELQLMNRPTSRTGYEEDSGTVEYEPGSVDADATGALPMTKEDLMREEQEIKELERKKQSLEERVHGMSRDLGGLMR